MYIELVVVKDIIAHSLLVITRRYIHPTLKKKIYAIMSLIHIISI